jgi:hypothetical protein
MNPHDCGNAPRSSKHPFPFPHLKDQLPPFPPNFNFDRREPEQLKEMHSGLMKVH